MIGYSENLALIHEDGFTQIARDAGTRLVRELRKRGISAGLVVDIGCGGGTLETTVIDRGYDALGMDISASMVRLARSREPRARYQRSSWRHAVLPPCVAIAAVGECLCYMFDGGPSDAEVRAFFQRANKALAQGGVLLFDVLTRLPRPEQRQVWAEDPGGRWGVHVTVSERRGILRREITSFLKSGRTYERTLELHRQRRFNIAQTVAALRGAGFSVRVVRSYGKSRFREGHTGFIATRR